MDTIVSAVTSLFGLITGVKPKFRVHGGSNAENLALQNIQVGFSFLFLRFFGFAKFIFYITDALILGSTKNGTCLHVCPASTLCQRTTGWFAGPRKREC